MTVLSAIKRVATVIGIDVPTAVFASTDRESLELVDLSIEMAQRIYKAHDWELLKTLQTMTGDDTTISFALPSDYGRMLKAQRIWSSRIETPLTHIVDIDRWLELDVRSYEFVIGVWTKIGGNIEIKPAMESTEPETAKFYYMSNLIVAPSAGSNKIEFTADIDTFRLDERLLKLGMVWQWKANKGLPYAEDMANYEVLLSQLIEEDKGSRILSIGRGRIRRGVDVSYPQTIVP